MTHRSAQYDMVVIGGGPAGSAAAIAGRRAKLRVLIVERGAAPRPGACPGWLGPAAVRLCRECGIRAAGVGVQFHGLRLCSWDLKSRVEVRDAELKGWLVDPSALSAALLGAAGARGAEHLCGTYAERLQLGETHATLELSDGRAVAGQVVVLADGADAPSARLVHLTVRAQTGPTGACAHAVFETAEPGDGLDVVLGAGRGLKLASLARRGTQVRATLLTHDDSTPATAQLAALLEAARNEGILPTAANPAPVPAPYLAGLALEMETHVAKRCVLVGDAGGFVSAFSNEGIYPALRSGWLAAEAVARALKAPLLQDELAAFSSTWRADLAGYLRMPNTDLGLLLPMIFNNPQMSKRVARAFLLGQAF